MVEGKHVAGLTPTRSAKTALAKLLKARLAAAVKRCRELTADAEAVHQLRVSTRRAAAALRLAKEHLPAKKRHRAVELLRELRRQGGVVRDVDIFLETIHHSAVGDAARTFLAGHTAYTRVMSFESLKNVVETLTPELAKLASSLAKSIAHNEETFAALLAQHARRGLREFDASLAEAIASLDAGHLHRVRIQAKRLRYTLELGSQESLVALIEKLQEILGHWHDAHAVGPRLATAKIAATSVNGAAGSPVVKGIDTLIRKCQRTEAAQLIAFRKWLRTWAAFTKRHPAKVLFPK